MFAIVEIAGFQEKVQQGDKFNVPLLDAEEGKKITFGNVMLVADGTDLKFGDPFLSGATVEAKVIGHGRDDKIRVFHMRRRKRMRKVKGHRQDNTTIEITKISL